MVAAAPGGAGGLQPWTPASEFCSARTPPSKRTGRAWIFLDSQLKSAAKCGLKVQFCVCEGKGLSLRVPSVDGVCSREEEHPAGVITDPVSSAHRSGAPGTRARAEGDGDRLGGAGPAAHLPPPPTREGRRRVWFSRVALPTSRPQAEGREGASATGGN